MSKALSNVIPTVGNVVLSFRLLACTLFIKCLCSNFVFQTNTKSQRHQTCNTGESERSIHSIVMGQASMCIQFVWYIVCKPIFGSEKSLYSFIHFSISSISGVTCWLWLSFYRMCCHYSIKVPIDVTGNFSILLRTTWLWMFIKQLNPNNLFAYLLAIVPNIHYSDFCFVLACWTVLLCSVRCWQVRPQNDTSENAKLFVVFSL